MDIEDKLIETQFYDELYERMRSCHIQEAAGETGDDVDVEQDQLESKSAEKDSKLDENKSELEQETDSAKGDEFTEQDHLEGKSSKKKHPLAGKFFDTPPILITDDFLLNPYEDDVTRIEKRSSMHLIDFGEDLSVDKWNDIDAVFLKYTKKGDLSKQQCSSAYAFNEADAIVSAVSSSAEPLSAGENLTSLPHIMHVKGTKNAVGPTSDNEMKSDLSFAPQFASDINTEAKKNRGVVFNDNYPLTHLPKYFDKILEIDGHRYLEKTKLLCIVKTDDYTEEKKKDSVPGNDEKTKDFVTSQSDEQAAPSKKNKKRRKKSKRKSPDVYTKLDSLLEDPSPSSSNLGPLQDSGTSSEVADVEEVMNEVVPETLESKPIPATKENEKDAKVSPARPEHETSADKSSDIDEQLPQNEKFQEENVSRSDEQATQSKKSKRRRNKAKKKSHDVDNNLESLESPSYDMDTSPSSTNLDPLQKSEMSSATAEVDGDVVNKVVPEPLTPKDIPVTKEKEEVSATKSEHEESADKSSER